MAKPITDKIAALKARQEKLAAQLNDLTAKAKKEDRKRDTRRKIVVGGAILAAIEGDPRLAEMVRLVLEISVTRPADRDVIAGLFDNQTKAAGDNSAQAAA